MNNEWNIAMKTIKKEEKNSELKKNVKKIQKLIKGGGDILTKIRDLIYLLIYH